MAYQQHVIDFIHSNIDDVIHIYWPTGLALAILYIPIFILSISNGSISKVSKWALALPIVSYLLFVPLCLPIRTMPVFSTCVGGMGIYYAQKVCEWILVRRNEFDQWSFFDIQHELFHHRVYTQPISVKKFDDKNKKEIFFSGPIQYNKQFKCLISMTYNIIKYYLLFDLVIYIMSEVFSTDFYHNYYKSYLLVRIVVNQLSGCLVFLVFTINYELLRYSLCLCLNRPLELMPDLFRQPYLAVSPTDFWSRWHQIFRHTWIELIFKPVSRSIRYYCPHASSAVIHGISSICVFIFSGLIHEYFVYATFHQFSGDQMKFFVIHGLAVLVEYIFKHLFQRHVHVPKPVGFFITFVFNGITAGYFMQPWLSCFNRRQKLKYSVIDFCMRHVFHAS